MTAALRAACGQNMAGVVSAHAVALAKGVVKEMFWSKMKLVAAVILMLGVTGAGVVAISHGRAAAPVEVKPQAKKEATPKVTLKAQELDDVASMLHIYKQSGKVELPNLFYKAGLKLDCYKAGRLIKQPLLDAGLFDFTGTNAKVNGAQFCLQAADLDYLPLAGGKKGFCRLQIHLQLITSDAGTAPGGIGSWNDVPKDVFDLSQVVSAGTFPAETGSPDITPLFYLLANTKESVGANTVADVIAKNDKADVLIVSLWTPK